MLRTLTEWAGVVNSALACAGVPVRLLKVESAPSASALLGAVMAMVILTEADSTVIATSSAVIPTPSWLSI